MSEKPLRDYQHDAVESIWKEWNRGIRSTMCVLPTGAGKTVVASHVTNRIPVEQRMLWLCHREELAFQAQAALRQVTGRVVHLEMGEYKASHRNAPIVVAMVQSLHARRGKYKPEDFHFGFIDECQHAPAKTYRTVIDYFSGCKRWLGLTATPKRSDGVALGKVFDSLAYRMEIDVAVDQGWLVAPRQRMAVCRDIDLRNVEIVAGDLHKGQLNAQLMKAAVIEQIARKSVDVADGRKSIVFCQTIDQAHALSLYLSRTMGVESVSVDGKTPLFARRDRVDKFRSGNAQFLCQVSICTEGFDVPEAEVTVMARPTKSHNVYVQACGRVLRPCEPPQGATAEDRRAEIAASRKPNACILDFVGNTGRHRLVNTGDLLGGDFDDDVRALAVARASKIDGDVDMLSLLRECQSEVSARPTKTIDPGLNPDAVAMNSLYAKFGYVLKRYTPHPFDVLLLDRKHAKAFITKDESYGRDLSKAVRFLEDQRLEPKEVQSLSNREQVYLARVLEARESLNLCTYRQACVLHKHGYGAGYTIKAASGVMSRVKLNNWRRPVADGPNMVLKKLVERLCNGAK